MSALTQHTNNVPDNQGFESRAGSTVDIVQLNNDNNDDEPFIQDIKQQLEMPRKHNIQSLLDLGLHSCDCQQWHKASGAWCSLPRL
eukprot:4550740-Ditylum_brightwellii.AAC.1